MIPPPPSESPNSQNPNFEFHPFFGFAANSSPSAAISASGAENAGDRVAGGIFSSPAAPRARNEKPNVSGRSKPRLVKLRRRTGSRTGILGSTPNNFDPGFSPFGQSSDPASDNIGMLSKSGNFRDNVKPVKFENAGLVFGANRIDLDLSLGSGKYDKRTGAGFRDRPNWRGVNSDSKKSDHAVFGGSKSDAVLTSNAKNRYLSGREGNFGPGDRLELNVEGEVGLGKFNEANVEAGASMSNSTLKSHSEQREFGGAMENCGLGDGTRVNFRSENFDKAGVQYSFNQHASASSLNLDNRNDAESIRYNIGFNNCADLRKLTANSRSGDRGSHSNRRDSASNYRSPVKVEDRKCDSRIFVFGSCQSDSISSLKQEKKKSCRNAEKLICKNRGKKIGINGKFGTDQSEGLPNLFKLKRDCGESSSSLVSDDKENMKVQTELDSQSVSTSSAWSKPVQTGSHQLDKSYGKGFASGGSHSYTKNEVLKKSEKFGNKDDDSITKSNMGLDANGGCNLEFGISKSSKNTPHGINPVSELSDEVKKLHIHGIFNANSTDRNKNYSSSCVQADGIFVFRSRGSSDSLKGSSVSVKQNKNSGVEGPVEDFVDGKSDSGEFHVHTGSGFSEILGQEGLPVHNEKSVKSQTFGISPEITFHAAVAKSCNANDVTKSNGASGPSSLLSVSPEFQPNDSVSEASSLSRSERESRFSFFSSQDNLGVSSVTFQTPRSGALYTSEVNFFQRSSGKLAFSAKSRSIKDRKLRKEIGKLGKPTYSKMNSVKVMRPDESRFLGSPNSSECYSPMDFSPYQNPVTDSQCSTGNFATPSKPCNLDSNLVHAAKPSISADVRDVDLITKRECFAMGEGDKKGQEPSEESSQYNWEKQFFQPETSCHKAGNEEGCFGVGIASAEAGVGIHSSAMRPESTCKGQFFFASCSQDSKEKSFTFSALPSTQCHSSAAKHRYRKKNRLKSYQFSAPASNASPLNTVECQIEEPSKEGKIKSEAREVQVKQLACEKWRFRGNQAYRHRKFSRAEDYYTKGINSVPPGETSGCCLDPLVLCYSNRAAARMSLGRTREALGDCRIAVALDPHFLKAQIRAANCHLVLGEVDEALQYFRKCHESSGGVCLDRRILIDAFDGMQKAQKVDESTRQIADLLQEKTCDAAAVALDVIAEALSISANSEKLLEMKAEALYMLRKYGEVICLCKQTVEFAEKNFYSLSIKDSVASIESSGSKSSLYSNLWRTHLISKCYFNMGKLDMALDLLEKQEQAGSNIENSWNKNWDSPTQLAGTIRELLCHKNAGNESFQAGRYTEAIEHYTTALTMNVESHPFAAILFCNRAAAHQALAQLADAISDCSLAMALDETYQKAISRRASLHEKIRDYGQAANDLRRLISVREKKSSESSGGPSSSGKENRQAHKHLSTMEEADKKGLPLDFYLILGVKHSDTASEIKKAYRKAALRHHPDKAGQLLTRNGSGDDGQMRIKIIEDVHRDADRLFKMIGEAYAVLSDPVKRSQYDHEEKIRNAPKESNNMYTRSSDTYGYPYQSGKDRHYWQGTYRTYGNSHSRW